MLLSFHNVKRIVWISFYDNVFINISDILFLDHDAWTSILYIHFVQTKKRQWDSVDAYSRGSLLKIFCSSMGLVRKLEEGCNVFWNLGWTKNALYV